MNRITLDAITRQADAMARRCFRDRPLQTGRRWKGERAGDATEDVGQGNAAEVRWLAQVPEQPRDGTSTFARRASTP